MGHNSPTEPGYPLPIKSKRPWWAAALIGGASAGVVIVGALGLGPAARGSEPKPPAVQTSSSVPLPIGALSLDERLRSIEATLKTLSDDMVEVKLRLPPKKP